MTLTSTSGFAQQADCSANSLNRLDMIQLIASSEGLNNEKGPRRDVSAIEIFALSANGNQARIKLQCKSWDLICQFGYSRTGDAERTMYKVQTTLKNRTVVAVKIGIVAGGQFLN